MFFAFPYLPREQRYNFPNPPKISTDFTANHPEGLKDADTRLERLPFEGWGAMCRNLSSVWTPLGIDSEPVWGPKLSLKSIRNRACLVFTWMLK